MSATSAPEGPFNGKHWCPAESAAQPSPRVVAFFGLFGVGNFGNEASLRAAHEAIQPLLPDAELVCIAEVPERVTEEHDLPAYSNKMAGVFDRLRSRNRWIRLLVRPVVEPARWLAAVRFLRRVDMVIVPGTGILDDFGVRPWQMPYDLFRWSLACRLTRTKLVYLSIGAGPIHNRFNRVLMKRALSCANYCSYRDETSRAYMASIGRDVIRDPVLPDLAWTLPRPQSTHEAEEHGPLTVGVGVMSYRGWTGRGAEAAAIHDAYIRRLAELCSLLLAGGYRVKMLTGEDSDTSTVAEVSARLSLAAPRLQPIEGNRMTSMADVLRAIAEADIVVATRFHNVVAALMMHRPVVSLGYAEKNRDLLECAGLAGYSHHAESFVPGDVVAQVAELAARRGEVGGLIAQTDARYQEALARQFRHVLGQGVSADASLVTSGDPVAATSKT